MDCLKGGNKVGGDNETGRSANDGEDQLQCAIAQVCREQNQAKKQGKIECGIREIYGPGLDGNSGVRQEWTHNEVPAKGGSRYHDHKSVDQDPLTGRTR